MSLSRRRLLAGLGAAALVPPFLRLGPQRAMAAEGRAERVIFFYYPDGVPGPSQDGDASLWHPTGGETSFNLPSVAQPLAPWRDRCVWFRGLSMGSTDAGSHPGGAKKLLTASDGGNHESIDQLLSRTVGAQSPWRHLYLGVMATQGGASGDKHIVYATPGRTIPPEDNPRAAFERLFGFASPVTPPAGGGGSSQNTVVDPVQRSVLDGVLADLEALRARAGTVDKARLDLHLDALREVELRTLANGSGSDRPMTSASCASPSIDTGAFGDRELYDASRFPAILRAQIDLMVLAMACGRTRVGTIQCSHHTSEVVMSRFPDTPMFDAAFDMRSHQASHYGPRHDAGKREFSDYVKQRQWFVKQFAYLLERLDSLPEGDGTMLDHTLCVLVTEVCDGNLHLHDDMPFLLAGGAGGALRTGRLLDVGYRRHGDLWISVAQAMGQRLDRFGDASSGPIPGLVS